MQIKESFTTKEEKRVIDCPFLILLLDAVLILDLSSTGVQQGGAGGGHGDIFSQMFGGGGGRGGGGPRKGKDVHQKVSVSLNDLYTGSTKKLRLTKKVNCLFSANRFSHDVDFRRFSSSKHLVLAGSLQWLRWEGRQECGVVHDM